MSGYAASSAVVLDGPGGPRLGLETATARTPVGLVERPTFFSGFPARPDVLAAGLLAVADVAASRYADAGLAKRLANLDPVVTASGDRLRLESFSACNSVHARLDLLPDGIDVAEVGFGTTNVDVNLPLRTALARLDSAAPLHLTVGPDELRAATLEAQHVERKVTLPDRWVRGLAEVPSVTAGMHDVAELSSSDVARFARDLPRSTPPGPVLHLLAGRGGPRLLPRALPGTVAIPGAARLRGMERVLRFTRRLSVHADTHGATAWVFHLPGARLTLALTADPYRGFSGEGRLLLRLAQADSAVLGRHLLSLLDWSPYVDADALGEAARLPVRDVASGLAWLAASGRLGHDLAERTWFHRELPVDSEKVLRRNPRLRDAQALALDGVRRTGPSSWAVRGSEGEHVVQGEALDDLACSCPWAESHAAGRGPCKHVLAVVLATAS